MAGPYGPPTDHRGAHRTTSFADADLAEAVPTSVRAAFSNQGEICLCGSRIFVERSAYDRFLEDFVAQAAKLTVGDPRDRASPHLSRAGTVRSAPSSRSLTGYRRDAAKTDLGALISAEHKAKVLSYIELAKKEGYDVDRSGHRFTHTPHSATFSALHDGPRERRAVQRTC